MDFSASSSNKPDLGTNQENPLTMEESLPARQINEPQIRQDLETQATTEEKRESDQPSASEDDVRKISGFRWVLICAALYLSALMYGLDTTIAADVQGAVIETFSEVSQLAWIGAGFPLGSVAVILPYGFLYTTFNMKWLYIAGIVLFQASSALCGAALTMKALIVGRVFGGVGGTGIYLVARTTSRPCRLDRNVERISPARALFGAWVRF